MINEPQFRLVQGWKFINVPVIIQVLAGLSKIRVVQKAGESEYNILNTIQIGLTVLMSVSLFIECYAYDDVGLSENRTVEW